MKGYRKLAPGEVILEGDVMDCNWSGHGYSPAGRFSIGEEVLQGEPWFRLARTDGCPPGWRWADAGELSRFYLHERGHHLQEPTPVRHEKDSPCGVIQSLMPFPEDERLKG